MAALFILICVAVLVIDEAKNKHLDLKNMAKNMEE
jgi:hypothetical protein